MGVWVWKSDGMDVGSQTIDRTGCCSCPACICSTIDFIVPGLFSVLVLVGRLDPVLERKPSKFFVLYMRVVLPCPCRTSELRAFVRLRHYHGIARLALTPNIGLSSSVTTLVVLGTSVLAQRQI